MLCMLLMFLVGGRFFSSFNLSGKSLEAVQSTRDALTEEVTSLGRRNTELEALAKAVPLLREQVRGAFRLVGRLVFLAGMVCVGLFRFLSAKTLRVHSWIGTRRRHDGGVAAFLASESILLVLGTSPSPSRTA